MRSKNVVLAAIGLGAVGAVGAVIAMQKSPSIGPGLPSGTLTIGLGRENMFADRLNRELYALPNDVTFLVTGTITGGTAPITAVIEIFMLNNLAVYTSVGRFAPTTQYTPTPPNNVTTYSLFKLPADLIALLGPLAATQTVKARLTLTNSVGPVVIETVPQTFVITVPPPVPVAPAGTVTIGVTKLDSLGPSYANYSDDNLYAVTAPPRPPPRPVVIPPRPIARPNIVPYSPNPPFLPKLERESKSEADKRWDR